VDRTRGEKAKFVAVEVEAALYTQCSTDEMKDKEKRG